MKKQLLFVMAMFMVIIAIGQPLSGVKTIPGDFATIAAAVTSLNANGVDAGGVTFNVAAGHTEISANILLTTTTASAANPIVFQKSGAGANPLVTAAAGLSLTVDGIIKIRGTDYVTFDGIDVLDPATNSTATTRMEWGYAILMTSATDASQNITIRNCAITLQKAYTASPYSSGIYSRNHTDANTTLVTPTNATGVVSNCNVDNCQISNVIYGINWTGSTTAAWFGLNNYFGVNAGNTITNFGGGSVATYGIFVIGQNNLKINNNTITGGDGTTGAVYGINPSTGANGNLEVSGNILTLTSGGTTTALYGIYNTMGGSGTNNTGTFTFNSITLTYPTATTATVYGLYQGVGIWKCDISYNSVVNCVIGGGATATATGTFAGIYTFGSNTTTGSAWNINGNNISDNQRIQSTRGAGSSYGIYNTSSGLTLNINSNSFTNNVWPSTSAIYGVYVSNSSATTMNVNSNEINGLTKPGALTNITPKMGNIYGIFVSATGTNLLANIQENAISNLTNTWGGQVLPVRCDGGTTSLMKISMNRVFNITSNDAAIFGIYNGAGVNTEIFNNRLYNMKAAVGDSGSVYGICTGTTTASSNTYVYNNYLSDLAASEANVYLSAALYAFGSTPGTNHKYFNNTVYLNALGTSGAPSNAAFFARTEVNLESRNNILVNNSTTIGGGLVAAFWRSGINTATYSSNSNFNCLHAGTPGTNNLLYYAGDATTPHAAQFMNQYLGYFPQEAQSFTEVPPFINIASTPYNLRIGMATATACESGGSVVATPAITADYDGEPRYPNPGYPDNPNPLYSATAPDVGADEFGGIPSFSCSTPDPGITLASQNNICLGYSVTFTLQNAITGTGISYQWQNSADGINFTNITGANGAAYSTIPFAPLFYQCVVTCQNGPVSAISTPVQIQFSNNVLTTTPGSRCGTGTVQLEATISGGTLNWYAAQTGGSTIATGTPFTTPSISTTTTYYAAADIPALGYVLGAGVSTSSSWESPFYHLYGGKKSQYLIRASELTALGMTAGNINSVAFEIVAPGTNYSTFNLSMGSTALTALTSTFQTGLTSVYSAASIYPTTGVFVITFSTPYVWDGTSNIILETCWSNNNTGGTGATVKYDATTYVSQAYYRADSQTPAVLCATATATSTMSSRPKMYFNYTPACLGPRSPVVATVTAPPALTIDGNQTVCNNSVATIAVTSTLTDYELYTWSPVANLFTDAACTAPYTEGTNAIVVYCKTSTGGSYAYTCSASNSISLCSNTAQSTITVLPNPVISAIPATICVSGSSTLSLNPPTGYGTSTFQWLESTDGTNYTNIEGATNSSYTTPTLYSDKYYQVRVKKEGGDLCSQPTYQLIVANPQVLTTAPGTRCGTGTVMLGATSNPGSSLNWYNSATGGASIGTGTSFTTPTISTTTSYYVGASQGSTAFSAGLPDNSASYGSFGSPGGTGYGMYFNATTAVTIVSAYVYPVSAGSCTFQLQDGSGTLIPGQQAMVTFGAGDVNVKTLVTLNFVVPGAGSYRLMNTAGVFLGRFNPYSGTPYPISYGGGVIVLTQGSLGTGTYYSFFDWLVTSGCESARTEVVATVTAPPAITVTSTPNSVCAANLSTLSASSDNANYQYTWMPGNLSGATQAVYPEVTTNYTVTANDPVSGCSTTGSALVEVNATPSPITITPAAPVVAPGAIQELAATGGTLPSSGIIGTGTTTNSTTGYPSPYSNYYGGSKHQMLIRASELTAAGLTAGNSINSLTFSVSAVGTTFTGSLNNFQIDFGHTTETVLTSTSFIGGLTNVFAPSTIAITIGENTQVLTTPFVWDGTSNLLIQTSYSNGNSGTSTDFVQMYNSDPGFVSTNWYRADLATAATILAATTPTSSGNARPNMKLGFPSPVSLVWSPLTDLYSDAAATIPYAGESLNTVYTKPLANIIYTVTANNPANGCSRTKTVSVTIQEPCGIPTGVGATNITAISATVSWSASVPAPGSGYEYEIRTSGAAGSGPVGLVQSGSTIAGVTFVGLTGLTPNTTYHAYVRSNCGDNVYSDWTADVPFTTLLPDPLNVTGVSTDNTCAYSCDGTITIEVTGGVQPYSYLWSDGSALSNRIDLCGGLFTVTVTDALNQTDIESWEVFEPSALGFDGANVVNVTCHGLCDGSIMPYPFGGTSPYSFSWSGPGGFTSTLSQLENLCAGTYYLTLTDVNGCEITGSWTVIQPDALALSPFITDAGCPTSGDGAIELYVFGGTYPYAVLWSNGATTQNISGLAPGNYAVTVTDNSGCEATNSFTVDVINPVCENLIVTGTVTTVVCYDALNTITVAGTPEVFVVTPTGDATFIAGMKILFLPGTVVQPGGYLHGYIAPSGPFCSATKLTEVTSVTETSPATSERAFFTLYPNPTNGNFTLIQKGENVYDNVKVEVYSMSGERILTETMAGVSREFRFSDMPTGLYFVKVVAEGYVETIKLVKTR